MKKEIGHIYYSDEGEVIFSEQTPDIVFIKERHRASVIVIDEQGALGLGKFTTRTKDLIIAGGGVEEGESLEEALHREAREELGCEIHNVQPIGLLFQYAKYGGEMERQHYHCFLAQIKGEKREPRFTEKEIRDGLSVVWFGYEDACEILKKQRKNIGTKTSQVFLEKIEKFVFR